MSFCLSQVSRKPQVSKQQDIKGCHFLIKDMFILSDNIRYGLWQYADFRFRKRNRGRFNRDIFEPMIWDLLKYCCNKSAESISSRDVINNENQILYEIKMAIYYGATRCLYDVENSVKDIDISLFKEDLPNRSDKPRKLEGSDHSIDYIKEYFKDLMI